jgi:hypothetical protein
MTAMSQMTPVRPLQPVGVPIDGYVPGVCNIGPWEARRRRAFAVVAIAAGLVLLAIMVATDAPVAARILLILPFWSGAFSWLQARRRFCAAFAQARRANFGDSDLTRRRITDEAAHRADMAAVMRMTRDSFVIAAGVTLAAILLPV